MSRYIIERQWVAATDLGTDQPWIPEKLQLDASYFEANLAEDFIVFYDDDDDVIFQIKTDHVISISRDSYPLNLQNDV